VLGSDGIFQNEQNCDCIVPGKFNFPFMSYYSSSFLLDKTWVSHNENTRSAKWKVMDCFMLEKESALLGNKIMIVPQIYFGK
jgi:hypothetical protein